VFHEVERVCCTRAFVTHVVDLVALVADRTAQVVARMPETTAAVAHVDARVACTVAAVAHVVDRVVCTGVVEEAAFTSTTITPKGPEPEPAIPYETAPVDAWLSRVATFSV
jgi:hypothetical protein